MHLALESNINPFTVVYNQLFYGIKKAVLKDISVFLMTGGCGLRSDVIIHQMHGVG